MAHLDNWHDIVGPQCVPITDGLLYVHRGSTLILAVGIIFHNWYQWLDAAFPGSTVKTILSKTALDLLIMSPIAWTVYFACLTTLERGGCKLFFNRAFKKGGKLYLAEWVVWPPAQVLNFYYLPTRFRVLCDMCIQLVFDSYASYLLYDEDY